MLKNNKGVTLLEVIITLVIIVTIFTLIGPLFFTGINFFADSNSMVMDQADLRKAMTDLSRELRDASEVTIVSTTKMEIGDIVYEYSADTQEITKYFTDTETTVVISDRVSQFEVVVTEDNVIEITVRAEGASSTIVTKVTVRERNSIQLPPIG